jgi:transposase
MARSRRTFTAEFQAEAVRRITEGGKSLSEVARELDPGEGLLRSRKRAPAVEEQPRRLRAENQRLRMERDISDRATAFFAKGSSRGTRPSSRTAGIGRPG